MEQLKVGDVVKLAHPGWGFGLDQINKGDIYLVSKVSNGSSVITITDLNGNQAYVGNIRVSDVIKHSFIKVTIGDTIGESLDMLNTLIKKKEEHESKI